MGLYHINTIRDESRRNRNNDDVINNRNEDR